MTRTQRLTFLGIAAAVAVVAVVVILLAGGGSSGNDGAASSGGVPLLTPGKVTKLDYTQGDQVRFQVRSDEADEVHVHGYDIERETQPGKAVTISFKADITGVFEIELHHSEAQIGQLTVEPK